MDRQRRGASSAFGIANQRAAGVGGAPRCQGARTGSVSVEGPRTARGRRTSCWNRCTPSPGWRRWYRRRECIDETSWRVRGARGAASADHAGRKGNGARKRAAAVEAAPSHQVGARFRGNSVLCYRSPARAGTVRDENAFCPARKALGRCRERGGDPCVLCATHTFPSLVPAPSTARTVFGVAATCR